MIIRCVICGYARIVKHEGTPKEIEQDIHEQFKRDGDSTSDLTDMCVRTAKKDMIHSIN